MTTARSPLVLAANDGEALWSLGALSTIKASAAQTAGRFSLMEDLAPRGEVTPFHVHPDDDESFYVLAGELRFYVADGQSFRATAGMFVHIPGGVVHAFAVDSDTARYLIITTPQHERFHRAISEPAASRSLPPRAPLDMDQIAAACQEHGVEILGPPPGFDCRP
ncbi:MAG: quercetin 2,3-dioxygenase [Thermomicrobiales bacterium]